ncbi:MAG: hypothetical protein ACXWKV_18150 [Caulobacteraceae bacterium]
MPISRSTGLWRSSADHFEPDDDVDPKAQRQLRGQLEQIDMTAYAANRKVLGGAIGKAEIAQFERLGLAAAVARTQWVAAALASTERGHALTRDQIEHLAHLRTAYEELTQVYDAMRRMVERGYLTYSGPQAPEA